MYPRTCRLRGGLDSYGATAPGPQALAGTSVTLSASGWTEDDGFVRELAEFTDRTGIAVEFTPDEARTTVDFEPDEPDRRPDVFVGGAIPAWARGPRDGHQRVRRPRDAAIRLRRVPAQRRNVAERRRRACRRTAEFWRFRSTST